MTMRFGKTLFTLLTTLALMLGLSLSAYAINIQFETLTGEVTTALGGNPFNLSTGLTDLGQATYDRDALTAGATDNIELTTASIDASLAAEDALFFGDPGAPNVAEAEGAFEFIFDFGDLSLFPEDDASFGAGFPLMLFTDQTLTGFDFFSFDFFFDGSFFDIVVTGIDWFIEDFDGIYTEFAGDVIAEGYFNLAVDNAAPVPEPSTFILSGIGLALIYLRRRQMRNSN